jgi:phosphoribosyl 1,2-cyclic phosphate phosphodiesterase
MKIRFLGTSAAGGFPNPHCRCENCVAARDEGGKSIRFQSSALINDDLLIDLGPDLAGAAIRQGIDLSRVAWTLQTHPHEDHLLPLHAVSRGAVWAAQNAVPMRWLGSKQTLERIDAGLKKSRRDLEVIPLDVDVSGKLAYTEIRQWESFSLGPYRIQTVAANHDDSVSPMLFAIEREGRRLFYGTDTTTLPDDTWPRLVELDWAFDVVVLDCNFGFVQGTGPTHLGTEGLLSEVEMMRQLGLVSDSTRIVGTHIAHHSYGAHSVESARVKEFGFELAWDGLVIEV